MKIAIRADGGNIIGMGHIMRTLVLAKELSKDKEIFYVCKNDFSGNFDAGVRMISNNGFEVILIEENNLLKVLSTIEADLLITDSYSVDENYFNQTKKIFCKTAYIDDLNKHYFNVDYLINQNLNAEEFNYRTNVDTVKLLGTRYLLLREEFRGLTRRTLKKQMKDIMITVGGSDNNNITEQLINYLLELPYNLHIVIGPSFTSTDYEFKFKRENINFYHNANMVELMKKCDLAITGCGSTLYECADCGIPVLGIVLADNQELVAEMADKLGFINNLGWFQNLCKEKLVENIFKLDSDIERRTSMINQGLNLIDGNGVYRIIKQITGERL